MSRTIRFPTPEMHAALDASRRGQLSQRAAAAIGTAEREWNYLSHACSPHRFEGLADADRQELAARRRRDGAYRRYLTVCHRIGRNYLRPIALKRGMTPLMRTAVAAHVREVHAEYVSKGEPVSRDELMCLAALFAAGNDDGQIVDGLQDLATEAARIGFHAADTLDVAESPLCPDCGCSVAVSGHPCSDCIADRLLEVC